MPAAVAGALVLVLTAGLASATLLPRSGPPPAPADRGVPVGPVDRTPAPETDPDLALVSVSVRSADLDDGLAERVAFCFSRPVRTAGEPDRLLLLGPDVDTEVAAIDVDLLVSDPHCLLAGFPPGTPVDRYTVAVAERAAAIDLDRASVASTVPVPGTPPATAVQPGGTSTADLVGVQLDPTLDRLAFGYDEPLDQTPGAVSADDFAYSTRSGTTRTADEVLSVDGGTVVVAFTSPGDDVSDAVRASSLPGAVSGRDGLPSPAGVQLLRPGGTTTPELRAVEPARASDVLFDFRFDEAVETATARRFVLYRSDATPQIGTAVTRPDAETVRVLFPRADGARPVLAAVLPEAVRGVGPGAGANPLDVVRLAPYGAASGRTTGPDLLSATLDVDGSTLRLLFDAPLEDDVRVDPAAVELVLPSGRGVPADTVVQVRDRELVLLVDGSAVGPARRVVVRRGAVVGENGEASAPGSRLLERTAAGAAAGQPTPTAGSPEGPS